MSLEYNKKKGRILGSNSSPRDLQRRHISHETDNLDNKLMVNLLEKVAIMTSEINNLKRERTETSSATVVSNDKVYTEAEFNDELTKALEKELLLNNMKLEVKDAEIKALEFKIEVILEDNECSSVDAHRPPRPSEERVKIGKRPVMEDSFVDPTENKSNLDPHIKVQEVKDNKNNMVDKVDKLKALFGGN